MHSRFLSANWNDDDRGGRDRKWSSSTNLRALLACYLAVFVYLGLLLGKNWREVKPDINGGIRGTRWRIQKDKGWMEEREKERKENREEWRRSAFFFSFFFQMWKRERDERKALDRQQRVFKLLTNQGIKKYRSIVQRDGKIMGREKGRCKESTWWSFKRQKRKKERENGEKGVKEKTICGGGTKS